ncbi:MAG: peptidase T [Clostridia bacterium]|nr:peptidase T [Clostridia bacterium]
MRAYERLLRYVAISTPACETSGVTPSSQCQFDLARVLADEMRQIGFANVRLTDDCFVYGDLPATPGMEELPCLGLIAHMDTAPAFNGIDVKPQIIPDYDGGDVVLKGTGDVLSPAQFPGLKKLVGKTLITTDGTTLLGADDKAGVAEILTACEQIIQSGRAHGKIAVAFTPDEEIGLGVLHFDVEGFGAKYAYTVDGGAVGSLSYENFNACEAVVDVTGVSVHPGTSKDMLINPCLVAMEFNSMLPSCETPRDTEGFEGFFHLCDMQGDAMKARLVYIVRDHSAERFEGRKQQLKHIEKILNHRWGEGTVKLTLREQYRNMREMIEPCFFLIENARKAMKIAGMEPHDIAARGGTDGAQLSYRGLPCPNLCTGGYAYHGPFEHIAAEDMDACVTMLAELICGPRN